MSKSRSHAGQDGFTLLEVMVAIAILTVGVISLAALAGTMMTTGNRSKYLALEASLASEKLEDLNHYSARMAEVCVPTGSTSVGSLGSDVLQTTTCPSALGGDSDSIAYYDDVSINFSNGSSDCSSTTGSCFAETITSASGGTTQYTTVYHSPDGLITQAAPTSTAPSNMTFHRRWVIEGDSPTTGVKRVTVLVTLNSTNIQPFNGSFQMSMVRP
jgi:prepilin-type N-terminal cleavage/methylation domain-containing protein